MPRIYFPSFSLVNVSLTSLQTKNIIEYFVLSRYRVSRPYFLDFAMIGKAMDSAALIMPKGARATKAIAENFPTTSPTPCDIFPALARNETPIKVANKNAWTVITARQTFFCHLHLPMIIASQLRTGHLLHRFTSTNGRLIEHAILLAHFMRSLHFLNIAEDAASPRSAPGRSAATRQEISLRSSNLRLRRSARNLLDRLTAKS